MSNYGQIIDSGFEPEKISVYEAFIEYFNNPNMVKIKDVGEYTMYMTRIHAMLGNAVRYLIVITTMDVRDKGSIIKLENLNWISLQTRTLEEIHKIPSHSYIAAKKPPLNQKITLISQDEEKSTYNAETFPLIITLIHTRKNNTFQYSPSGTIVSALETFQTIINFKP